MHNGSYPPSVPYITTRDTMGKKAAALHTFGRGSYARGAPVCPICPFLRPATQPTMTTWICMPKAPALHLLHSYSSCIGTDLL